MLRVSPVEIAVNTMASIALAFAAAESIVKVNVFVPSVALTAKLPEVSELTFTTEQLPIQAAKALLAGTIAKTAKTRPTTNNFLLYFTGMPPFLLLMYI